MKKLKFYKRLLVEMIETQATICRYLSECVQDPAGRRYRRTFLSHYSVLKNYSEKMRNELNDRREAEVVKIDYQD